MKPPLRALLILACGSLLIGSDCMFGRPIVDERSSYYPSDGVVSCSGTRCSELPSYELSLPPALESSPCAEDLPSEDLAAALRSGSSLSGLRLTVSAERPLDLNLPALDLRDACVIVSGAVRLTLAAGSRLTRVMMMLGPALATNPDAGARGLGRATPDIHLDHTELDQVSLQPIEEGGASGRVQLEFATCSLCATNVDSLNVIESQVHNSRLAAASLTVVGGAFDTVELAFEYGLLAGLLANDLRTTACNALSLVGATIAGRASQVGPCDCGLTRSGEEDAGAPVDAGRVDASAPVDAGPADAQPPPAPAEMDAAPPHAGPSDGGVLHVTQADGAPDAEIVAAHEADGEVLDADSAGAREVDAADAGASDAGSPDAADLSSRYGDAGFADETCLGATISQSTFFGGMVDGKVRAENSTFRSVLFARHAPTSLDMWSTNVELSVSCGHPLNVRLDKRSGIGCTSCDAAATAMACRLDQAPKLTVNKCPSFRGGLPECVAPLPTRRTPPIPMPPKLGN